MASFGLAGDIKFEVDKFDRRGNFGLWQLRMKNTLIHQDIKVALSGKYKKPEEMKDAEWTKIDEKIVSLIQLYLSDEVLYNVMEETTSKSLWESLRSSTWASCCPTNSN